MRVGPHLALSPAEHPFVGLLSSSLYFLSFSVLLGYSWLIGSKGNSEWEAIKVLVEVLFWGDIKLKMCYYNYVKNNER